MASQQRLLQQIPAVDALLNEPGIRSLRARLSHGALVALIREELGALRTAIQSGAAGCADVHPGSIAERVGRRADALTSPPLGKVINATGILIHTNLGRAPLCAGAQQAVADVVGGYCNLEYDLEGGRRTSRLGRVRDLLTRVTGAADALAVNNNAAAVYLGLHVLAAGREVIVSRGELVEIGGSFRLPDVMQASGALLREVGTTNRTRIEDYAAAISDQTAMLLKVHPSNFQITGYTHAAATGELAHLAREHDVLMMEDLGSGALAQHPRTYLREEPRVQETLQAGADLVCFSGDKLLGGPQAGVLLGRADLITRLAQHPLARVLRLDKLHLAALEATLVEYLAGEEGLNRIPLYRMMQADAAELRERAAALIAQLAGQLPAGWQLEAVDTEAAAGGGSLPGLTLPSAGVALAAPGVSMEDVARHLRQGTPPVVGRIEQERLILDLRTLVEDDWVGFGAHLAERLQAYVREQASGGGGG